MTPEAQPQPGQLFLVVILLVLIAVTALGGAEAMVYGATMT
jgi:hypothetical protein